VGGHENQKATERRPSTIKSPSVTFDFKKKGRFYIRIDKNQKLFWGSLQSFLHYAGKDSRLGARGAAVWDLIFSGSLNIQRAEGGSKGETGFRLKGTG